MRTHYRAFALAISLALRPPPSRKTPGGSASSIARSPDGDVFFYQPLQGQARSGVIGRDVFDNTGIGRPNPRNVHPITPVPDPRSGP